MPDIYEPVDIFISKEGTWHHGGLKMTPQKALLHTDVVWNAMHGAYGENGRVQKILQNLQVPFTGSLAVPSALTMNKNMTKEIFVRHGLLIPKHETIFEANFNDEIVGIIFRKYLQPVIIKPVDSGSSIGMSIAHGVKEIKEAMKKAFNFSQKVLVEEYIKGKPVSCGIIDNARGEKVYALMPMGEKNIVQNKDIERMAKKAHEILELRHYSQSDFIISPKGKIYILETDSQPVFHDNSVFHKSLRATGWQPKDFVHHVIQLTLKG